MDVIIIDDEIDACKNLEDILKEHTTGIRVLATAHNTQDAESKIKSLKPDAIFIDIEMPHENAFHFLERIFPFDFELVFVTAYDAYAIKAFKLNAIDYILKPINITEMQNAVKKLKERVAYKSFLPNGSNPYKDLSEKVKATYKLQTITLKNNTEFEVVGLKDIFFIEGKGSYSKIHFTKEGKEKSILMSNNIADYEELLPVPEFYRIHKSYIINGRQVEKIVKKDDCHFVIVKKHMLPISRRRYSGLLEFLERSQLV